MPTRRDFIKQSSLLSAALMASPRDILFTQKKIGLQLYTVRNEMSKDPKGTLERVAKIGYKEIETFGYNNGKWFGMDPAEMKAVLRANGLHSPSGHTFPGGFLIRGGWEDAWKKAVEDSKAIGQEYIVIPWLEENYRTPIDNFKKLAEALNKAAAISKAGGLQLAYHNHDFEFVDQNGQHGYDILMKDTDPSLVKFELDIYWAVKGGHDPLHMFKEHPGRFALWHVKDMDNTEKRFFTEVGNGIIQFKPIFAHAKESGMKYFFVEQDICPGSPFDSITKSFNYLEKNIVK